MGIYREHQTHVTEKKRSLQNTMSKSVRLTLTMILLALWSVQAAGQRSAHPDTTTTKPAKEGPRITFVELGSVNCIPCKQMHPVMKAIGKKYGNQIKVVFHDVWTRDGRPYASLYKIKLIPTQVFLDVEGKEIFRHEGYFPETEIDKLLQKHGLKIQVTKNQD